MSNNNPKDVLLAVETVVTASPSLVATTCLKELVIGRSAEHASGYPLGRIWLDDFAIELEDTETDGFIYGVNIELWQELTNKSKRNAELDLANALHQVLVRLRANWQLGIGVEKTEILPGQIRQVETNVGPALLAPIKLRVTTLVRPA
jgi:hypothetical protein